ncbi:hypothetical protein I6H96_21375 [Brucella anthropi]|uniref:Uncharacterized protein n=1 Tax=Brucella anthropi (strain ATCC 49188 / DSM 6882 / CCUG 24695 / JCM 21032 / LMG 3331 / NBRC 15819 / NCTC 12168 / Alc 37) TaxID=439375 RepID=A6X592_BRUA4|nr:hypothetical protein [Brucella anthropi]ABS16396.1 hypothetical protein Oant_3690 [Brucella anthropi ATCC 49188]NKC49090.1 hypothetical protein [Brucella anthropi ATCC 49188]QQC27283.1 hypothetical protein I6H96_21375 [Brucella anthropi]SUB43714.1 Uncharacterised protein [Brucella anthropi]
MKTLEVTLSGEELATILNLTDRRIRQLATEGVIERAVEHGQYLLHPSVSRYVTALESRRDPELQELNRTRAKMAKVDLAKREGSLIALDESLGIVDELVGTFVSTLNMIPAMIIDQAGLSQAEFVRQRRRVEDIIDTVRMKLVEDLAKVADQLPKPQAVE